MPKVIITKFETLDGEEFREKNGNIEFANHEYPDGYVVLQTEEIQEFIEWLQEEYNRIVGA